MRSRSAKPVYRALLLKAKILSSVWVKPWPLIASPQAVASEGDMDVPVQCPRQILNEPPSGPSCSRKPKALETFCQKRTSFQLFFNFNLSYQNAGPFRRQSCHYHWRRKRIRQSHLD